MGRHLETLASVGGLAGLFGALLYYFGWARASATFGYFGLGVEMLDLSFQDYLLRSVDAAFWPLLVVGLVGLAVLLALRFISRSSHIRVVKLGLACLGIVGILVGLAAVGGWITFRTDWPVVSTGLLASTLLVAYGLGLLERDLNGSSRAVAVVRRVLVATVVLLLAYWTVSNYAGYRGVRVATAIADDLADRTGVIVYSETNLHLRGRGVTVRAIDSANSAYRYCFAGLRLLIGSGDKLVLLPEDWRRGRDPVIVLDQNDQVRFEYVRSSRPAACP